MGCGASKECAASQTSAKQKKKRAPSYLRWPTNSASSANDPIHLTTNNTPASELIQVTVIAEQQEDEAVAAQGGNATNGHFDVPEEGDDNDINADDLNILTSDPAEDLENKPPASQTIQKQWRVATRASPLRELSIGSNGELHIKRNHLGTFPVHSSSPGSNNYYIRVSPSSPSMKSKSSFCPPLHTERLKNPCSARTWYLNDPTVNPNFIKDIADQQLCKETRSLDDDDTLKVVGRSYYSGMQDMNPVEAENQEEIFKSDTDQENMDGFIEDLQEAFDSGRLTSRLKAYGASSGFTNEYMRELMGCFDKSVESLEMATTPRTESWHSMLLETINRDIDSILLLEEDINEMIVGKPSPIADAESAQNDRASYGSFDL